VENQNDVGPDILSQSANFPGAIRNQVERNFSALPPSEPANEESYSVVGIVDEDLLGKLTEQMS
jgi:hypothetical protein